jgi:hypothetical protein
MQPVPPVAPRAWLELDLSALVLVDGRQHNPDVRATPCGCWAVDVSVADGRTASCRELPAARLVQDSVQEALISNIETSQPNRFVLFSSPMFGDAGAHPGATEQFSHDLPQQKNRTSVHKDITIYLSIPAQLVAITPHLANIHASRRCTFINRQPIEIGLAHYGMVIINQHILS